MVLPIITLSYLSWALLLKVTRSSMLESLRQDFVTTARSKGLSERAVINQHVRPNALIPVTTISAAVGAGFLDGVVITETIFDCAGGGAEDQVRVRRGGRGRRRAARRHERQGPNSATAAPRCGSTIVLSPPELVGAVDLAVRDPQQPSSPRRGSPAPGGARPRGAWLRSRYSERSAAHRRSARLRTPHGARRCSRRSPLWAVELRREESRRGLQDRVGPPELTVLLLERPVPLRLRRGDRSEEHTS